MYKGIEMKKSIVIAVSLTAGIASADFIDFENDAAISVSNGFVSADSANVSFSDTLGADLSFADYGTQGDGNSLGIFGDDASRLLMSFSGNISSLSLDFGNDDGIFTGGVPIFAYLRGLLGGVETGIVSLAANNDDLMNQSISINGNFDQIEFYYALGDGSELALIEIVDNINFNMAVVPLPPAALAGLGMLAGLGAYRRIRS